MRYGKRIIFIILAAMGTLCFNGCQTNVSSEENNSEENAYMKLSAEEAKEIMDSTEDYILLDVREEDEYAEGHIKDALLMPYGEITERTILVYCRSGRRSAIAAQTLTELGYTNVKDFGGIIDWTYDLETE